MDRWPRNRWRIGFAITHLSMLLILVGALVTVLFKQEGQLPLWEGQSPRVAAVPPRPARLRDPAPFAVRLDAFEMDVYPGTQRRRCSAAACTCASRPPGARSPP